MTETSPFGVLNSPTADVAALPTAQQRAQRTKQGRPPLGVELKLVDDSGAAVPEDGATPGLLHVRGAIVASGYYQVSRDILDQEGFFDTGDVATIDPQGYLQITDRAKDLIKSGGEWISSIEIEGFAIAHAKAAQVAVIGVPHAKWDERPRLIVQLKPGQLASAEEFIAHLKGRVLKWWLPDDVLFVDTIPLGATGKVDKKALRTLYGSPAP